LQKLCERTEYPKKPLIVKLRMSKKIGFDLQITGRKIEREESKKGDK
jgi:hypothetical protein